MRVLSEDSCMRVLSEDSCGNQAQKLCWVNRERVPEAGRDISHLGGEWGQDVLGLLGALSQEPLLQSQVGKLKAGLDSNSEWRSVEE